ncbi:adenine nucleotide alpha hydrolases-like superfamily protein [Wolffia australiana]
MADEKEAGGSETTSLVAPEWRIAVAVDESEESIYALEWCFRHLLSAKSQNTVILIYSRPPPPVYTSLDGTGVFVGDEVISIMEKYSKELAESVLERSKKIYLQYPNIKTEMKVGTGDARDVICDLVEKVGADLLVIGSHGYGFVKRALLGSVSDYCARNAKCPVLIVKRNAS